MKETYCSAVGHGCPFKGSDACLECKFKKLTEQQGKEESYGTN
jgi:hypothetical protein